MEQKPERKREPKEGKPKNQNKTTEKPTKQCKTGRKHRPTHLRLDEINIKTYV